MRPRLAYVYVPAAIGVAVATVFAAPVGTRLAHRLQGDTLKRVFAGLLLLVAASLAFSPLGDESAP